MITLGINFKAVIDTHLECIVSELRDNYHFTFKLPTGEVRITNVTSHQVAQITSCIIEARDYGFRKDHQELLSQFKSELTVYDE